MCWKILKWLVVEWNWPKIGPREVVFSVYGVLLTIKCSMSHSGHLLDLWLLATLFVETAGHRTKRSEIWHSGILVTHIWGTFDHVVFRVTLESFGALASKIVCTLVHLSQKNGLQVENGWSQSEKVWNLWLGDTSNAYMGYLWRCSVQSPFGVIRWTGLKKFYISKRMAAYQNGEKSGTRGH